MSSTPISVFVPASGVVTGIDPGSGIVAGTPARDESRILVDYEGNRYGAVNMVTFADRVARAWDRQRTRYPTIARAAMRVEQLVKIGEYDAERGVVLLGEGAPMDRESAKQLLADWLEQGGGYDELSVELERSS